MMLRGNTVLVAAAALLAVGSPMVQAQSAGAQDIRGNWQVTSLTTRAQTLDGKETFKGPFTMKEDKTSLKIDLVSYIMTNEKGKFVYRLKKVPGGYQLQRTDDGELVTIQLSNIKKTASELRFTSTRQDTKRKERTVVNWVCVPSKVLPAPIIRLVGPKWELVEIQYNNDTVLKPKAGETITATFGADKRVTGNAGANRFNGSFTANLDRSLKFSPLVSTRMANPPGSIADTYLKDLGSANHYRFDKDFLILQLPVDAGILKFRKAAL